jgi:hypothetical protein
MVQLTKRGGDLIITASNAERHLIKEMQTDWQGRERGSIAVWYDAMEYHLCNGWDSLQAPPTPTWTTTSPIRWRS